MDNIVTIPKSESCVNFNHSIEKFCLPAKKYCSSIPSNNGLLSNCGERWNQNIPFPTDKSYFIPIPDDGKIIIQTKFYDQSPDRKNPTLGWGSWITAELYNSETGALISNDYSTFSSRAGVGYDGTNNYQNLEIDKSLIGVSCFYIKIKSTSGAEVCTQDFRECPCDQLVELVGIRSTNDCNDAYYGLTETTSVGDDFEYSNRVWLVGIKKYFGSQINKTEDDITSDELLRFYPKELIAPFMMKYLSKSILISETVLVDGEEYEPNNSTFNPRSESSMFLPVMEFVRECESATSGNGC